MAYPNPPAEKTLQKRYAEAGLHDNQVTFLRTFFKACANYYGILS